MTKQHQINFTNHTNVEVSVNASNLKYSLKENDTLRGKKIMSIDIFKVDDVTVSPLNKALVNNTIFKKSFLVLNIAGEDRINKIPMSALCPTINNGKRFTFADEGVIIDWAKSYIEIANNTGLVADESFLFNVYYNDKTK